VTYIDFITDQNIFVVYLSKVNIQHHLSKVLLFTEDCKKHCVLSNDQLYSYLFSKVLL